ncbi:MAG: hypothetical protein L3K25_14110 [Gammaproteobacteria bacterium]|nr:hypothetical protein [Gammaproteobacteria bacterium]
MDFGINNKDRTQWQLERVGGYDKHGHVFSIARPLTGSVSFPVETFPSTAALEQFINEYTFFRYWGCCPTWRSVLNKSDCFSGEERDTGTLKGKNYTPEGGKDYVIQLISSGELVVHRTGSWIPSQDRNHHLPWPKSTTKKEEFLPPSRTSTLGPHEEPGYVPPVRDASTMEEDGVGQNKTSTTLSQPGGLSATEGAKLVKPNGKLTKPTHPLERHGPNVRDEFITNRVQTELIDKGRSGVRTRFDDRATMESVIADSIQTNQKSINVWLASNPKAGVPKAFEHNPEQGNLGTGFEVSSSGNSVVKVTRSLENVNTVLIPDGKGGYLIHTAHPF